MAKRKKKIMQRREREFDINVTITRRRQRQVVAIAKTLEPALAPRTFGFPEPTDQNAVDEQTKVAVDELESLLRKVTPKLHTNDFGDGANVLIDAMMIVLAKHNIDPCYAMIDAIACQEIDPKTVLDDMCAAISVHHGLSLSHGYDEADGFGEDED